MSNEKTFRIYLCGGPHCAPKGREVLMRALKDALWMQQLEQAVDIRVSGCQDRCDFAPNLTVWPGPYHYSNLTPQSIARIVEQHLAQGQPVTELLGGERRKG